MNIRYITIEREFGSGGTKIARCLSESTGIPCYGKEILENASKKLNMSIDEIEKYEENVTNPLLEKESFLNLKIHVWMLGRFFVHRNQIRLPQDQLRRMQ